MRESRLYSINTRRATANDYISHQPAAEFVFFGVEIVLRLEAEPELLRDAKKATEAKRRIS